MSNSNWIKLNRKLLKNPYWLKKPYSKGQAIVDLLLIADFKNGTFSHSYSFFAKRWGWSNSSVVFKFFKSLEKHKFIQKIGNSNGNTNGNGNGNTNGNAYLIVNYGTYQSSGNGNGNISETPMETPMENNKRSNIKELIIKEIEKEKKGICFDLKNLLESHGINSHINERVEDILLTWYDWLDYKLSQHRFRYKTEQSENQALVSALTRYECNVKDFKNSVYRSIEGGWMGIR